MRAAQTLKKLISSNKSRNFVKNSNFLLQVAEVLNNRINNKLNMNFIVQSHFIEVLIVLAQFESLDQTNFKDFLAASIDEVDFGGGGAGLLQKTWDALRTIWGRLKETKLKDKEYFKNQLLGIHDVHPELILPEGISERSK